MGARVAAFDWAATSLGHPDTWSIALRTAVAMCLTSRFPMLVVWGPDLVKIYNDGYRVMLGAEKHPRALGAPARTIWPEVWDVIGPMFDEVRLHGRSTWHKDQLLVLQRNGYAEECYFDWSYSPLYDDDGTIGGVLDVVTETTPAVVAVRRLSCLTALAGSLVEAEQVADVCLRAVRSLALDPSDLVAVDVHLQVDGELTLMASAGSGVGVDGAVLAHVGATRRAVTVGAAGPNRPATARVVPLGAPGGVEGVLAVRLAAARPFDRAYENVVQLVAGALGAALDNAHRRAVELGEYRRIGDTLQQAMLTPAADLPMVASRYRPAAGNLAVGGDWYDVVELDDHRRGVVVGDCVGHGLDAATAMGQLRSAARAMLLEGGDPAAVLTGLDAFASSVDGAACATVACVVFDRRACTVTYALAGHPPALLARDGRVEWLGDALGPPLTASIGPRSTVSAVRELHDGDRVVLYTDGLVERPGESLDVGMGRLADAVTELASHGVHAMADGLLQRLVPERARDDVVVVVKSFAADPPDPD